MRWGTLLGTVVLAIVPTMAIAEEERVGAVGDVTTFVFEGLESFSTDELRRELASDFDTLLASAPDAPRAAFLKLVSGRLTEGFRQNGFPQARVTATVAGSPPHVVVRVEEGRHFRNGDVKVAAAAAVAADKLASALTRHRADLRQSRTDTAKKKPWEPPSNYKLWKSGEVADFHTDPTPLYREAIETGLAAQGFFYPTFRTEVRADGEGTATLWIHVDDEGPKATVGNIIVIGTERHTPEEVIDFLGIEPGQTVDGERKAAWEQKLKDSACFVASQVVVDPAIGKGAPSDLRIFVTEPPDGPKLGEELTEQDQVFVKWADWMSHWSRNEQTDLVITAASDFPTVPMRLELQIAVSPREGLLIDVNAKLDSRTVPLHYTLIAQASEMTLVSWHRKLKLQGRFRGQLRQWTTLRYVRNQDDPNRWDASINPNIAVNSSHGPNVDVSFDLPRGVAVAMGREPEAQITRDRNTVQFHRRGMVVKLDAETGRLLGCESEPFETRAFQRWSFREGELQRRVAELEQQTADFQSAFAVHRPVSSVGEFFLAEVAEIASVLPADNRALPFAVWRKLLEREALRPVDRWVANWVAGENAVEFSLPAPSPENEIKLAGLNEVLFGWGKPLARLAYQAHTFCVPRDSGFGQIGWSLAMFCTGHFQEGQHCLERLSQSEDIGPLTCWYGSYVYGWLDNVRLQSLPGQRAILNVTPWSRAFAEKGLTKLDAFHFRREVDGLLPADGPVYELADALAGAIRELDESEVEQLAALWTDDSRRQAHREFFARLRQGERQPAREALIDMLTELWTADWQARVQADLKRRAAPPAAIRAINYEELKLDKLFPGKAQKKKEQKPEDLQFQIK